MRGPRKSVKLGLIGCGRATNLHLSALQYLPNAEVLAVADIDADRLQRMADRFHIQHRCADYQMLLKDPDIDAVALAVIDGRIAWKFTVSAGR